jgi:mono/diheme cytochrome c family protein
MDDLIAYLQTGGPGAVDSTQYFDSGSPRRGREVFSDKQCDACHTVHGKGGRGGPDLGARTGDLVASVATIASVMWNHSPPMQAEFERRKIPRVTFSGQEMVDVIAYLYFVNYTTVRATPATGAKLFAAKCATCHAKPSGPAAAPGGVTPPDLTTRALYDEPLALTAAMWNHGPKMGQELEKRGLVWPRLENGEAADLAAFLLSRPHAGTPVPGARR